MMTDPPAAVPTHSSRHAISVLIVTAAVLWNLAALTFASKNSFDWRSNEVAVLLGLAFAQTGLAAAYFAWGRLNVALRAGVLLAAVAASWRIAKSAVGESAPDWFTVLLVTAIATTMPLLVGRFLGIRLLFGSELPTRTPATRQFRIWDVMSWTTAVAAMAAANRWMAFDQSMKLQLLLITLMEAVVISFCFVAPLSARRFGLGILVAFGASALFVAPFTMVLRDPSPLIKMTIVEVVAIISFSSMLRLGGYRLRSVISAVA